MTGELTGKGIGMLMAIHGAVRRDLDRLATAVAVLTERSMSEADRAVGAAGFAAYWDCFADQLHHHHTIEDAEVFPYLRYALEGRGGDVLDAMGAEHDAVDEAQAGTEAAVQQLVQEPTAGRASMLAERVLIFQQVVLAHLEHEEAEAIPLIIEGFDDDYWQAFMSRRQQEEGPDAFLPWVLDGAPEPAVHEVTVSLPPPVRELLFQQWTPAHESRVAALPR
jgi:hemerythrin-like domain-containing protein